ncbi:hypothetical protein M5689_000341 [Euphorbia peplus]|nr:hypothetical protein M5689_000341 [Euphorbia peplus]
MVTVSLHLLFVLFSFALFIQGNGQCGMLEDFVITQSTKEGSIENKTQWFVNVTNNCLCTKTDISFDCNGFQTSLPIDPQVLSINNGACLYNNGGPLHGFNSFTFSYAWDPQFQFKVIGGNVQCS